MKMKEIWTRTGARPKRPLGSTKAVQKNLPELFHSLFCLYFSDEYKDCMTDPLSNEHEQYYKFVRIVNRHFNKESQKSDGSVDEVLDEYIETCRENGRKVEYLFELWNNESKAEDYKWKLEEKSYDKRQ